MAVPEKKVCIIIALYNAEQYIQDCFSSLEKIYYPKNLYSVVVIDDKSSDNSVSIIETKYPYTKIIKNQENLGFSGANNIGMKWAVENGYDYVYLLNQDTVVEPDFLNMAVEAAETDEKIGSVQSRLMLWQNKELINSIGNSFHYLGFGFCKGYKDKYDPNKKYDIEITYPSGAGVLIKSQVLEQTGFFDNDFYMYHEDVDLGLRILLSGYKNILAQNSVVYHKYSFSKSIQKYYFMERNRFICLFKLLKLSTIILIFPAFIVMELGLFCFSLKSGWWKEKVKVYKYFLKSSNWDKIIQDRETVKKMRKIPDRQLTKSFVGKITYQEPEMQNWILEKIANPVFYAYWWLAKKIIFW